MPYRHWTNQELANLLDTNPDNVEARDEAVRRFVVEYARHSSGSYGRRQG